jgi:glutamate N-acetyltransferase/amino-acid N-acetyltransferase
MTDTQHPTVSGFSFAAAASGIKPDGQLDLGLIVADEPVAVAAMFTKNRVRAAPVELSMQRVERGRAQAIVVNSGNANACTGKKGLEDAKVITSIVADELGVADDMVLMASTGVIGRPLPSERIEIASTTSHAPSSPPIAGRRCRRSSFPSATIRSARCSVSPRAPA